jgi:hypothetical protein
MSLGSFLGGIGSDIGSAFGDVKSALGSTLSNPLVDAGLGLALGPGAALVGKLGGSLLGGGQSGTPAQSGGVSPLGMNSAIPSSAFNTSMGTSPSSTSSPAEMNAGGSSGLMGALGGAAGDVGSFLTGNGGKNALGALGGVSAYLNQQKANDYAKQALGSVESAYNAKAPLRSQGLNTLSSAGTGNPWG